MRIYTLTGDDGTTSLSGGRRVPKHSLRVEAYGSVDELIAWIGLIRVSDNVQSRQELYLFIQDQLMRCAAALAYDRENSRIKQVLPADECVGRIEREIDSIDREIPPLGNFILPGGSPVVSHCHIARCVCRRAERAVLRLNEAEQTPAIVTKFLNRLSDFLFVLSRKLSYELGNEEVAWKI